MAVPDSRDARTARRRRLGRWLTALLAVLALSALPPALVARAQSPQTAGDAAPAAELPDARDIIAGAIDQTRGRTSYAEMSMTVARPDWQRSSRLVAWTRGREDALIRFTAPPRDAGNATLKVGEDMWTYNPRLRRVIRLPQSLMSQSWAGSDFSYNDLSRSDDLLRHYDLRMVSAAVDDEGHRVYVIDAIPVDDAPVVWGRERLTVRDDYVLLGQVFYDQEGFALKSLETLEVREMDGRPIPARMRMVRNDEPGRYTEVAYELADFDVDIDDSTFTQFRLRQAR